MMVPQQLSKFILVRIRTVMNLTVWTDNESEPSKGILLHPRAEQDANFNGITKMDIMFYEIQHFHLI